MKYTWDSMEKYTVDMQNVINKPVNHACTSLQLV